MSDHNEPEAVRPAAAADPDQLLEPLQKAPLLPPLAMAIVAHVLLVALLSIGYIGDAVSYGTFDVRGARKAEAEEAIEAEREAKREAARASQPRGNPDDDTKIQGLLNPDRPVSAIEREVNETSDERPEGSEMDLGGILDDLD